MSNSAASLNGGAADMERLSRLTPHDNTLADDRAAVLEAPRRTPVAADVDVIVAGGGPAGVGAALAAAREGARVLLVECHGMLGGMWTAGLVNPFFDFARKGWLVAELLKDLDTAGAWKRWRFAATFETEVMKHLLEAKMGAAGVTLWYYARVVDAIVEAGAIRGVIVESKSGREAVLARTVVDCTGDGDVAARSGVPYAYGRVADGLVQPMTLMFEIAGTGPFQQEDAPSLYDAMAEAIRLHKLPVSLPFDRVSYVPWVIATPVPGVAAVQCTHVYRLNPLDVRDLTGGTVEARRQVWEMLEVLRRVPGLENIRLAQTAATLGVRESRRVRGQYVLSLQDLAVGRRFADAVAACTFGVDIHEPAPGAGVPSGYGAAMRPYEIPYRCLVPLGVANLLVAGRCISGTHEAHASYRVTGTCMAMGQAAGLAAAWAAAEGRSPSTLDGAVVRRALEERGVGFLE